jgi:hypothetical protein
METIAFWTTVAIIVVASHWFRVRSESLKHETLRQIIEKTGQVQDGQLKALIQSGTPGWLRDPPPGAGYRALRVLGTIVIFVALGLTVFFSILWMTGPARHDTAMIGYASTSVVAMVGAGFFYSSRFLPPPSDRNKPL